MDQGIRKDNKTKKPASNANRLSSLAVRTGLEPATPCVTGTYSNQLNYRTDYIVKERLHVLGSANLVNISFIQKIFSFFSNFNTNEYLFLTAEATITPALRLKQQRIFGKSFVNIS